MRYDRPRYVGIMVGLFGVMLTFLLSDYHTFELFDHILYDAYIQYPLRSEKSSKDLVIIEIQQPLKPSHNWSTILDLVQMHNPKQIIFTSWPKHATKAFYQASVEYGNVIFGRRAYIDTENPSTIDLEPLPDSISNPLPPYRLVAIPPARHGIHRFQHASFNLSGKRHPALEVLVLERALGPRTDPRYRPYRLNFKGGSERLPKVALHRALAGGLVPELIEGRYVLIDTKPMHSARVKETSKLYTPLHPHHGKRSMLEYHGLALDTLLSGQTVIELGRLHLFFLLLILLLTSDRLI